jgi:uncharacterized membrane protein YdbT with pleckstrin-like domain
MRTAAHERVVFETRRHGVVLARAFVRSFALTAVAAALLVVGWPWSAGGALLTAAAAFLALAAVWRWERTRIILTTEKLCVVHGTFRRHAAAVQLSHVGTIELEQTLLGRLLGYGTLVAGELEIDRVRAPGELCAVVQRVAP